MQKDIKLNLEDNPVLKRKKIDNKQKLRKFNFLSFINPISNPGKRIGEFFKQKRNKQRIFLILMQTRNGKYDLFTITSRNQTFKYENGFYYIDPDMIRENLFTKMNMLFYHQDCAIPFKINFNIGELREELKETNSDVEKAINPLTLKSFINAQVIEKVLKGAELSKEISMIKMIVIINTIAIVGLGLLIAKMGGMI